MAVAQHVSPARPCASLAARCRMSLALAGLLTLAGCGPGGALHWRLRDEVVRPRPGVVLFLCDGLAASAVEEGCRDGRLPNIQQRFLDSGLHVRRAATCIPAITYAAITTLLTGVGPDQHTIVGNRWFDPERAFFRNYATIEDYRDVNTDFDALTIYERLQPAPSASIQAAHTRGLTHNFSNWAVSGVMWYFQDYTAVDKLTATSLADVAWWANEQRRWPTLLTCYFPGADSVGHDFGASSPQYRRAVEQLDYQIGRVCAWLEAEHLLETTYLVLVADHGMVDVKPTGYINLPHLVRDLWGRKATDRTLQDGPAAIRRAYFDRHDTVVAYHNGRGAFLYFRGQNGWDERPAYDQVECILTAPPEPARLWNIPGVALVANLASDNEALVRSAHGAARIVERQGPRGPEYAYLPDHGDVLGYLDDPSLAAFVAAGYHDSRAWLRATAEQRLPDVVPPLVPFLHVRRAGDVVVFTEPGYSFVPERGGHGGLSRDEMRIPFMIAGPGITPGSTIDVARSVDLVPTLLKLLGLEDRADASLEGESLFEQRPWSAATGSTAR